MWDINKKKKKERLFQMIQQVILLILTIREPGIKKTFRN